jgi:predicted metal-binding membrane protein
MRFRSNPMGVLRLGAEHGRYCLGCCWALMALLFVGGVMNLLRIAGLAALFLVEKTMPAARFWVPRVPGLVLAISEVWLIAIALHAQA